MGRPPSTSMDSLQPAFSSCHPSLWRFVFTPKSKLVARKQGPCAGKASAGKEFQAEIRSGFRKLRRAHRAPSRAPLQRNNSVLGERMTCPPCTILGTGPAPSRKRNVPHGFFAQGPCFRAGQRLKFNWPTPTWRKVKAGKAFLFDSPLPAFYNHFAFLSKKEGVGKDKGISLARSARGRRERKKAI